MSYGKPLRRKRHALSRLDWRKLVIICLGFLVEAVVWGALTHTQFKYEQRSAEHLLCVHHVRFLVTNNPQGNTLPRSCVISQKIPWTNSLYLAEMWVKSYPCLLKKYLAERRRHLKGNNYNDYICGDSRELIGWSDYLFIGLVSFDVRIATLSIITNYLKHNKAAFIWYRKQYVESFS